MLSKVGCLGHRPSEYTHTVEYTPISEYTPTSGYPHVGIDPHRRVYVYPVGTNPDIHVRGHRLYVAFTARFHLGPMPGILRYQGVARYRGMSPDLGIVRYRPRSQGIPGKINIWRVYPDIGRYPDIHIQTYI